MEEILSPIGNRHPNSHLSDQSKAIAPPKPTQEFEEGTEEIPMPSKGVFYPHPYYQADVLHCRNLDFRDEDILTTQRYIEDGSVFDKTVSAVIQDEGMTAGKLVPIDRDTILIWLRVNALGKIMSVEYRCKNIVRGEVCDHKNQATWDLSEIQIPEYKPEVLKELMENGEFKVVTPQKQVIVFLKVPLIEESKDTEKRFTKKKQMENIEHDTLATQSLELMVSGVQLEDGKVLRRKKEIMEYFKKIKLPLGDARWIRTEAQKINLSYDTKKDLVCAKCGYIQEGVSLPIVHENFLWTGTTPQGETV